MPSDKHDLLRRSLQLHFETARSSVVRSLYLCAFIAVAGSIALGVVGASIVFFFMGLVVVFVLTLPIPLVVRFMNVSRVRPLQRKVEQSPEVVTGVDLIGVRSSAASGAIGLAAIYGGRQRVVVLTQSGERYVLWLPPENAAQLAAAYR